MDRTQRISTGLVLSCIGSLAVLALVAGFVPESDRPEVRRFFNRSMTVPPHVGPVTRPLSHVTWQVRGLVGDAEPGDVVRNSAGGDADSPLAFVRDRVMLRTAEGRALLERPDTPTHIVGLLPPATTDRSVGAGDKDARLRLEAGDPACRLSASERDRLLDDVRERQARLEAQVGALQARALRYRDSVERYAARYNMAPDLIYAIIYTESSFNPGLISSQNAHGLMQVVPETAGGEVHTWLGRAGVPAAVELLNPEINIRYGTSYLHLLLTRHLNRIENPRSREYCAIAAYNIGSGAMLRVFGPTREDAFETVNMLTPEGVRDKLLQGLPSRETRAFLEKVISSRSHFVALAGR